MRYFAEFSYLGTAYSGWQSQPEGQGLGIQTVFENALGLLLHEKISLTGAGRTDAGVHARQMFAHFDTSAPIAQPEELCRRLNSFLPADIAVKNIFEVRENAHARFDAVRRQYKYFIHAEKDPFHRETSYYLLHQVDTVAMNLACRILKQYEDFQCFSKVNTDVKTFVCHIEDARWECPEDGRLVFTITADRFLRNMVRAIVGTMLDVGRGKLVPEDLRRIIESRDRCASGMSVDARGLFLWEVVYSWESILR